MKKLNHLAAAELILLQKHIELGRDHLIRILGKKGFEKFLHFARPSQETMDLFKADDMETTGNLILVVNTIITGSFGGWMGFSGVMEMKLGSSLMFEMVLSLAVLAGIAVGYLNFRSTKQEAIQAIQTLQLTQFEIDILNEIQRIREYELEAVKGNIQATMTSLSSSVASLPLNEWLPATLHALDEKIFFYQKHPAYLFFKKEVEAIKMRLQRNVKERKSSLIYDRNHKRTISPLIESLISVYPQETKKPQSWFKQNFKKILISLIPTLFGGFGSLFVYLSGGPQIAQAFEYDRLVSLLMSSYATPIKITISILVTLYFGFSSLYSLRKNYRRSMEIEAKQTEIVKKESSLTLLDDQLVKLRHLHEEIEKAREMFQTADAPSPMAAHTS
jgi:hypothetical protein